MPLSFSISKALFFSCFVNMIKNTMRYPVIPTAETEAMKPNHVLRSKTLFAKANSKKNVRTRHGGILPIQTRYTYTYTVGGKEYRYASEYHHGKRRLLPKVPVVYVKWFPRHAYPYKFKGTTEWVLGIMSLFGGIMCMIGMLSGS